MLVVCSFITVADNGNNGNSQCCSNANLNIQSITQQQHVEQAMNMIQEQHRDRLNRYDNLTFTELDNETTLITGDIEADFLGFIPAKRMIQYKLANDGVITRDRRMFDFMYRFSEDDLIEIL